MTDFEQLVVMHTTEIAHLKELRIEEKKLNQEFMERIWSALNDLKERVTMTQEHTNQIQELQKTINEFKNERNKIIGGWITLTAVGAGVVAVGSWVAAHWDKINK